MRHVPPGARYCMSQFVPSWLAENDTTNALRLVFVIERMTDAISAEGWLARAEWHFQDPPPFAEPGDRWDKAWVLAIEAEGP